MDIFILCVWPTDRLIDSSVIGHTSNPFNRSFSCGGSSGGEGALLGMRGK